MKFLLFTLYILKGALKRESSNVSRKAIAMELGKCFISNREHD